MRNRAQKYFHELQTRITDRFELTELEVKAEAKFVRQPWERSGLGGGEMRLLRGALFEKAGVNFSAVQGERYPSMAEGAPSIPASTGLLGSLEPMPPRAEDLAGKPFFATGVSLVVHPTSPFCPTVHMNVRYLEVGERRWFGGGTDLTPCNPFPEDTAHFHGALKTVCDRHGAGVYPRFSSWCDSYFFIPHRQSPRGVGGIFFDYLPASEDAFSFVQGIGDAFLEAYTPIIERRRAMPYGEAERAALFKFRGRYVEFNLVYDRGTLFGLKTGGNIEAILMSLPPLVSW